MSSKSNFCVGATAEQRYCLHLLHINLALGCCVASFSVLGLGGVGEMGGGVPALALACWLAGLLACWPAGLLAGLLVPGASINLQPCELLGN